MIAVYRGQKAGKEYLIEEYFYDANGMRSQKNTYDGATVKTTHYIHLGNNVLYETTGSETTRYILAGNREIAKITAGKTYYTHRDHLGSSLVVTDSSGKVVNWNSNHPYGENWQIGPAGTADLDKHRFTGKETDGSTGLIYFGTRFYDPEVGRFLTADTYTNLQNDERILLGKSEIGKILRVGFNDTQRYNQYSYCQNNPVNRYDPDGHFVMAAAAKAIAGGILGGTMSVVGVCVSSAIIGTEPTKGELIASAIVGAAIGAISPDMGIFIGFATGVVQSTIQRIIDAKSKNSPITIKTNTDLPSIPKGSKVKVSSGGKVTVNGELATEQQLKDLGVIDDNSNDSKSNDNSDD